ncbi:MAG: hypothetical protein QF807_08270, partial [Candidatus Thalassarchaeaceae archaeon]|nr:hypothetical protein [Candidatus Thalassarchaeaceae archaeon]
PVLAKAKSQASWDHDACRLRSLPDIPDWATSRFSQSHILFSAKVRILKMDSPEGASPQENIVFGWI